MLGESLGESLGEIESDGISDGNPEGADEGALLGTIETLGLDEGILDGSGGIDDVKQPSVSLQQQSLA